jgi:hypothetical protein
MLAMDDDPHQVENALVDGISVEQAVKELEGLLKTGTLKRSA